MPKGLYCFSPLVMALTVMVELALLLQVIVTRKKTFVTLLAGGILLCLAIFQGAEYAICETGFSKYVSAQIGLIAITALPPLGVHLVQRISGKKANFITYLAYASMFVWWYSFLFGAPMQSQSCGGNYVVLKFNAGYGQAYFVYYYWWMLVGMLVGAYELALGKQPKNIRYALVAYALGYLSFIVPATVIWLTVDSAREGLPSIMCGFAVVFALILGLYVVPKVEERKQKKLRAYGSI